MLVNPSIYNGLGRYNTNLDLTTLERRNNGTSANKVKDTSAYKNSLTDFINKQSYKTISEFGNVFKSDLKQLRSAAADLSSKSSTLYDSRQAVETSTDFDATASNKATIGSHKLKIDQLASAQVNSSEGRAASATLEESFTRSFKISQNGKETDINVSFNAGETNAEAFNKIATAINKSQSGVKATVKTDEQGYAKLEMAASATGSKNAFQVSGTLADEFKLNESHKATDLNYTLDGKSGTASDNAFTIDNGKVSIRAKSASSTESNLEITNSGSGVVEGLKKFAESYNKFVSDQSASDNPLAKSIVKQLSGVVERSLKQSNLDGMSVDENHQIKIDSAKLTTSVNNQGTDVKDTLTRFDSFANAISRKATQIESTPNYQYSPSTTQQSSSFKAFMYNYNAQVGLSNLNQLSNTGSILDVKI